MTSVPDERLLLVHAHPDDETIQNGATMAKYVAMGRGVTLVTCTAGEMGEILVPELEHLAADREDGLGEHRRGELDDAMKELGVTDHRFLGGFGTYRDSGMQWHADGYAIPADDTHENAFWNADLREAADHLVAIIREIRPQVLLTYDQFGNYGHPDHIQAHRVATYAAALAAVPSYKPDLGEAVGRPQDLLVGDGREPLPGDPASGSARPATPRRSSGMEPDADFGPFVTPDEHISARVDGVGVPRDQAGGARAAPQPGGDGRPLLPGQRERPVDVGRRVLPASPRAPPGRPARTAGSRTSSPDCDLGGR